MTKNIDNRLFNFRRYTCSNNLVKPKEILINTSDSKSIELYNHYLDGKELIYQNTYCDYFDNEIIFVEYL